MNVALSPYPSLAVSKNTNTVANEHALSAFSKHKSYQENLCFPFAPAPPIILVVANTNYIEFQLNTVTFFPFNINENI